MDLKITTLPVSATIEEVVSKIRQYGIAIIPSYFNDETIKELNNEFDIIIDNGRTLDFNIIERSEAITVAIVRNRLSIKDFPVMAEILMGRVQRLSVSIHPRPILVIRARLPNYRSRTFFGASRKVGWVCPSKVCLGNPPCLVGNLNCRMNGFGKLSEANMREPISRPGHGKKKNNQLIAVSFCSGCM